MRLAHVSDLHFGHHDPVVSETLAADLASQRPDLVVVSGDFTQVGSHEEYRMACRFLESLSAPYFAVPGNHDLGRNLFRRFLDPYRLYRRYIAPEIEPVLSFEKPDAHLVLAGLNTTRRALADRDWSNGSINRHQIARLETKFQSAPADAVRIVVAHHPLMQPALPTLNPTLAVRRSAMALEAFDRIGVRLVLSGHFHLSFVRKYDPNSVRDGIPRGPRRAAQTPVLVCQASSTISNRLRGQPNAYNLIDIRNGVIDIRVREWVEGVWETREEAEVAA
jgi:3',5'-cyclic AMP phosphodiesterase CpdA